MIKQLWQNHLKRLTTSIDSPTVQRLQKHLRLIFFGFTATVLMLLAWFFGGNSPQTPQLQGGQENMVYKGAGSSLPREEVWVRRLENSVEEAKVQKKTIEHEFELMKKQVDLLNQTIATLVETQQKDQVTKEAQTTQVASEVSHGADISVSTLGQVSLESTDAAEDLKTIDTWIPAGSYAQGVLVSGIVASTATSASSNPQPVVIRLIKDAKASRGWIVDLKDVYLIGACFGDLSSERASCRLSTLSYTDPSGEVVEKEVEGWIVDSDGRYGLFGHVVDRSDEVAKQALISGILGGIASFFQAKSSQSVYPVSPFGQTNPMSTTEMIKGSSSSGVGKALEKLADFAIKRAESMSPVILIDPGRVVDVVFKKSVDRSNDSEYGRALKNHTDPVRTMKAHEKANIRFQHIQTRPLP